MPGTIDEVLLVPAKSDLERDALSEAWARRGGRVLRLERFWEPPAGLPAGKVRLYGSDSFCQVLAQILELKLVSPADDWLLGVAPQWLKRELRLSSLGQVGHFPCFVKSMVPKQFRSVVYSDGEELGRECQGLAEDTPVLVSEVVALVAEARGFFLKGQLQAWSLYEGESAGGAEAFFGSLSQLPQPHTCVLDIALIAERGWALLEANATWGAGLNGCDPEPVVDCLRAAVG